MYILSSFYEIPIDKNYNYINKLVDLIFSSKRKCLGFHKENEKKLLQDQTQEIEQHENFIE